MSKPSISQYQGSATLCLNPDARFKFSFGVAKAKMILEHLAEIQEFVASGGISCVPSSDFSTTIPVSTLTKVVKDPQQHSRSRSNPVPYDAAPTDGVNLDFLRREIF
jgi:hypothetical protein